MRKLIKPFQWLYSIYALLVFIILMLVVVPLVIAGSFFGRIKGGNFIYEVCRYWAITWNFLVGIRHQNLFEQPHDASRHYIFVANHISYLDIPPIVLAIRQPVRVLAKHEMASIPVFGFIYKQVAILVDRSNAERRAKSVRTLKSCLRKNISIFIFPEGTFNLTPAPLKNFYDGAFRIAIETGTNIKPVLFIDTPERLHHSSLFSLTPGKNRAVFLEEVSVEGYTIEDIGKLREKVYQIMDAGLRRYRRYEV